MANHSCMNNTNSNANQYSTPLPVIGLYIAGATSVCLLLMLLDIISGLRRKSLYIPCRFFRINSATLTLIGIAAKLPVDLTTYMPSARDQLSKLTGTAMVCVCIGFFMPSLAINRESENIANMIALSLLVVTIFVNICIQMSTSIIFSFMVEHIMILCCMLTLLFLLWWHTLVKEEVKSYIKKYLRCYIGEEDPDEKSLKRQLWIWYANCRILNPQLLFCNDVPGVIVHIICILCLVVVSRATFRSVVLDKLEFCQGVSDYGWSMWMIIITQIITLVIGSLTIGFRWLILIMMNAMVKPNLENKLRHIRKVVRRNCEIFFYHSSKLNNRLKFSLLNFLPELDNWLKKKTIKKLTNNIARMSKFSFWIVFIVIFVLIFLIIAFIPVCLSLSLVPRIIRKFRPSISKPTKDVFPEEEIVTYYIEKLVLYDVSEWMTRQCMKDMNKWMLNAKKGGDSTNKHGMVQMLSTIDISSAKANLQDNWQQIHNKMPCQLEEDCKKSCILLMVIIVKIFSVSIPLEFTETLRQTLDEAFEIIYFIDERIHTKKYDDQRRRELAKLIWTSGDIDVRKLDLSHSYGSVEYAISIVVKIRDRVDTPRGLVLYIDLEILRHLIERQEWGTVEELCRYIEQLFAAMLHDYLAQLPNAIIEQADLCPVEEMEERAKVMLQLLYGLDLSLEDKVRWVSPKGTMITRMLDDDTSSSVVMSA